MLRTDFSNDAAWEAICAAILAPDAEFGLEANVTCLSDSAYTGLTTEQVTRLAPKGPLCFMFIVDQIALTHPEHPILVVDLNREPGQTFRTLPSEVWSIEANLSLANIDFFEYADSVDHDGIFRGYRDA
ncbi:MAG: hypothetical protein M3R24_07155 [Chloroflexota bacterium]|nr:hypothetical protein [Chloroflexota bacterium]